MFLYYYLLWNPALSRVLIFTPTVYPHLVLNYDLAFFIKVDPLKLESQNQAKNIPVVLSSSPIKMLDNAGYQD